MLFYVKYPQEEFANRINNKVELNQWLKACSLKKEEVFELVVEHWGGIDEVYYFVSQKAAYDYLNNVLIYQHFENMTLLGRHAMPVIALKSFKRDRFYYYNHKQEIKIDKILDKFKNYLLKCDYVCHDGAYYSKDYYSIQCHASL